MPQLLIKIGNAEQVHELTGSATIGRGPDNSIVLDDDSVSTHHSQIDPEEEKWVLRDLHSTNGTLVNGQPISEVEIHDGDAIVFGSIGCHFKVPATPYTPTEEHTSLEPQTSFGSKLTNWGKAALQETKRNAHLASIKARIEKAKHIDLNKAHYELGRKCFEAKCFGDKYELQYKELADLTQNIHEKRQGIIVPEHATAGERIKAAAHNTAGKATAEALTLKFKQLFTILGGLVAHEQQSVPELAEAFGAVNNIHIHIKELELEYATLAADQEAKQQLKSLSGAIVNEASEKTREASNTGLKAVKLYSEKASATGKDALKRCSPGKLKVPVLIVGALLVLTSLLYISKPLFPSLKSKIVSYVGAFQGRKDTTTNGSSEMDGSHVDTSTTNQEKFTSFLKVVTNNPDLVFYATIGPCTGEEVSDGKGGYKTLDSYSINIQYNKGSEEGHWQRDGSHKWTLECDFASPPPSNASLERLQMGEPYRKFTSTLTSEDLASLYKFLEIYKGWLEASRRENLSPGIVKNMPDATCVKGTFNTNGLLTISFKSGSIQTKTLGPTCALKLLAMMNTLPDQLTEAQEELKEYQRQSAVDAKRKMDEETKRREDENKATNILN